MTGCISWEHRSWNGQYYSQPFNVQFGTITIPTNASVPLPVGTAILVIASAATTIGSGSITLIWAGVGSTGSRALAQYGQASLIKVATDVWYISGTGLS
jgi:hypothetical protein